MSLSPNESPEPQELATVGVALAARRRKLNLTRKEVADRARMGEAALAEIEAGRRNPEPAELVRLARHLRTTPGLLQVEGELSAAIDRAPNESSLHWALCSLRWAEDFRSALMEHAHAASIPLARPCTEEAGRERLLAEDAWKSLEPLTPMARKEAVGEDVLLVYPLFQRWGLAEKLCAECEAVLSSDPRSALGLAELALQVAGRVSGTLAWQRHLKGYAWAYIAKAKFAGGDRAGAEEAVTRGKELWNPQNQDEPDLLEWPKVLGS